MSKERSIECWLMDCILPDYCLTREKYKELWDNCIFVLDTNVLFNLYRYSPKVRDSFIDILNGIADRLWVPNQVAFEYYDNKSKVINNEISKYKTISKIISKCSNDIKNDMKKEDLIRKHTSTSEITDELMKKLDESFEIIRGDLEKIIKKYPEKKDLEIIDEIISKLLLGKVGRPYSVDRLGEISSEGLERYKLKLPPGYEDEKEKEGIKKFGDLILWFQIIDMAKEMKKPVILICEDLKEDWWWTSSEGTIGPRPELIQEFSLKTGMLFHMYSLDQFMKYANEYRDTKIDKKVIQEAKDYRYDEWERWKAFSLFSALYGGDSLINKINLVNNLVKLGKYNEAYLEAFEALELYFLLLCEIDEISHDKKISINELASLVKVSKIRDLNLKMIDNLIYIRNNLAHGLSNNLNELEIKNAVKFIIDSIIENPLDVRSLS